YFNEVAAKGECVCGEASINVAFDSEALTTVTALCDQLQNPKLKFVVVVGIGGSNLGTLAICEALFGKMDAFVKEHNPKILFVDTVDTALLDDVGDILTEQVFDPEEVIVCMITKSGTTTETVTNFEFLYHVLYKKFRDTIHERVVAITDLDSKLWSAAQEKGFHCLEVPKAVGGRYSVFTNVGLFPLLVSNVDVHDLLSGAREMRDAALGSDHKTNFAMVSAVITYLNHQKGFTINNNFFFNRNLEGVGKWYRQLMGESIGKKHDTGGQEVYAGITPLVSIGTTDLHSMAQLYLGGPRDKFTNFVYSSRSQGKESERVMIPKKLALPGLVPDIAGKSFVDLMDAIYEGVKRAYANNGLPFMEIVLPQINAYTLGQYMQFKMMEMMYLAKLLGVNAFDQPSVEEYKKETQALLKE
ncbi:MAG TPA: hypothetical protein VJA22_01075, partial [Patescibacteria group bacterium]|nr:hypothetical protein [Patescibacteria group bacterium]